MNNNAPAGIATVCLFNIPAPGQSPQQLGQNQQTNASGQTTFVEGVIFAGFTGTTRAVRISAFQNGRVRSNLPSIARGAGVVSRTLSLIGNGTLANPCSTAPPPPPPSTGNFRDRLQIAPPVSPQFGKVARIFAQPRCVNCHGGLGTLTTAHTGGNLNAPSCTNCHSAGTPDHPWRFAGSAPFIDSAGGRTRIKPPRNICLMVRDHPSAQNRASFENHVDHDPLIRWAFGINLNGQSINMGNQKAPAGAIPQSLGTHATFVRDMLAWFDAGKPCDNPNPEKLRRMLPLQR